MKYWVAVTGAGGYVGSHICKQLKKAGYCVIGVDRNHANNTHTHQWIDEVVDKSFNSKEFFDKLAELKPIAVIHCAANSLVGPSVTNPTEYYDNNVTNMKILLDKLVELDIKNIVFSSSSSIYGNGHLPPVSEDAEKRPLTSYGKTKFIGEMMLQDYATAYGLNSISFRYFNACGADPDGDLGQVKDATHLIARIMENVTLGSEFSVYGNDYDTPDGTCVRDYTHVSDIAEAHVLGVLHLINNEGAFAYNLGSGTGSSVMEIISASQHAVTNGKVNYTISERRPGDPDCVYADITKVKKELNWEPQYQLDDIVKHAFNWYSKGFKNL